MMRGLVLGWLRLRSGNTLGAILFTLLFAIVAALFAHLTAARDTLLSAVFGIALPVLTWALIGQVTTYSHLDQGTNSLARYGRSRRALALGLLVPALLVAAVAGVLLGVIASPALRTAATESALNPVLRSAGIGALAALAYAMLFAFGSTFGTAGQGRFVLLVSDWILGSGASVIALPWPRAHLLSLLGAKPVLELPTWSAAPLLAALVLAYLGSALLRTRP